MTLTITPARKALIRRSVSTSPEHVITIDIADLIALLNTADEYERLTAMPRNHESTITIDPLIVECPVCLSGPGDRCVRMNDGTTPCPPHDDRWSKARCFLAHPSQVAR